MKSSFDKHLQFDLPYRYELTNSRADDGSRSTAILCNTSFNDSGDKVGEVQIKLGTKEGGIREEARNLRADFPAALLGTISEMGIGIGISSSSGYSSPGRNLVVQILMLIVAIEFADQTYILLGVKTGMERDESENIELLTRHMNRVLECLTLDGKRGNFARLTTTVVRRALKENALKNEKDPTASIRSTRKRSTATKPAPAKSTPPKPAPSKTAPAKPTPAKTAEPRRTDKPIRSEHELRSLIKRQKKAKREAEEAVRLELKRRETARKEAIETAALQNTVDRAAIEEIEERRRSEREALEDWERRERRLSARRGERADALAAQALNAALHSEREHYRALARREIPRQEDLREELAQLEAALGKLGAFAGSEKKAKRARIAEVQAELEASERTLKEAMRSCETAEERERAQLNARRAEFLSAAEQEITLEPRPEQTAQAKERPPAALEMLLAQKLRVGAWYGKDTLRAMLPDYEMNEELMDKVIDRLKRHNCVELDKTRDTVLCRYIQRLPKPVVKQNAFKREVEKILEAHNCGYAIGDLTLYFDERITSSDILAALTALMEEGAAKMEYDGPTPIYSGTQADAKTRFDPETTPIVPVGLSNLVSTPSAGTPPAEPKPTVQLQEPHLEREEAQELILMLLSSGFDYSVREVTTVLNNAGFEQLPARLNTLLRDLCAQGRLEEKIRGRARYYSKL